MANTPSAKKRVRQLIRKTEVNNARRSRIKSFINTLGFEAYLIDYFSDDVEKSIKNLLS